MTALAALSSSLLGLLPVYGYAVVGASVFAGATGFPLPVSVLLLAAGALTADGVLDFPAIVLVALVASVAGDCVAYGIGRLAGRPLLERAAPRLRLSPDWMVKAERAFGRWGGGAVWITRWLLTVAGPPVSVLAGADAYPFRLFFVFALAGEVLWAGGYVGLGWVFGDNWDELLDFIGNVSWFAAAAVVTAGLGGLAWHLYRRITRTGDDSSAPDPSGLPESSPVPRLT